MDSVFHGLPFVTTYIDDVLIHSSSEKQHKEHLETIFQVAMSQMCYLGHVITGTGMQLDPNCSLFIQFKFNNILISIHIAPDVNTYQQTLTSQLGTQI